MESLKQSALQLEEKDPETSLCLRRLTARLWDLLENLEKDCVTLRIALVPFAEQKICVTIPVLIKNSGTHRCVIEQLYQMFAIAISHMQKKLKIKGDTLQPTAVFMRFMVGVAEMSRELQGVQYEY
jgi:hypothetical protein